MGTFFQGDVQGDGLTFAIVVARFNREVTECLLSGALEAFAQHGVDRERLDVVWVPGSLELPVVAKRLAQTGRYDAIVALGCVIRHQTRHFDLVCQGATQGLVQAALDTGVPVLHGVLACYTLEQARDRAGGPRGNKGYEVAVNAIEMGSLLRRLRSLEPPGL